MLIRINNGKVINIIDRCLVVNGDKLFNIVTRQYEGIDGDEVTYIVPTANGGECTVCGIVDGYTCNRRIMTKGCKTPFAMKDGTVKKIKHRSSIIEVDGRMTDEIPSEEDEWAIVLKA